MKKKDLIEDRLYTVQDAAAVLGVSDTFLRNLIRKGRIIAIDLGTGSSKKTYRIQPGEIRRLLGILPSTVGA